MWSWGTRSPKAKGPVPTGCWAKLTPSCWAAAGETIIPARSVNTYSSGLYGRSKTICTVAGSTATTFSTGRISVRRTEGNSGSCIRSKLAFTASALNDVPSWNFTPWRSLNVTVLPSGLIVHDVIDVAPTLLEAAGLPEPVSVNGVQQKPIEGVSMLYSFNDPKAAERHETQYFEMFGNRGIYHKGWTAVTRHKTPWLLVGEKTPAFDDDVWELYDTSKDWSQARDLSKEMPEKLHELQRLWLMEATRYNVLPLDDDLAKKMNPDVAGRPSLIKGNTQALFSGMGRLSENCVLNLKNKSHSVTAAIVVPQKGAQGVIIAQGANIGGWSLYANKGKLKYCYNLGGVQHFYVEAANPLPPGEHQVRMEFAYAGGGLAKGGKVTLYTDGKKVAEGDVAMTLPMVFSADDGLDVGEDSGAPVSEDYGPTGNAFNGRIKGVQLAISKDAESVDHLVKPEDAIRIAMARQ